MTAVARRELDPDDRRRLDELFAYLGAQSGAVLGYPCTGDLHYDELFRFLRFPVNNVGDPYSDSSFHVVDGAAVFTLIVDRYDDALAALRNASLQAYTEDAFLVRLKDEPGALARLAKRYKDAGVDIRAMRIVRRQDGWGLVALSADDREPARELVKDLLVKA